jgi:UDP-N-acetylmuramate dehydrogenase
MSAPTSLIIRENVLLRDFTTFRIGGPARFFCEVASEAELEEAIVFARAKCGGEGRAPFFILGGGSNVLVSDAGFGGLVIKMNIHGINFHDMRAQIGAGENWDEFVAESVSRGLYGVENLSGIPGTVGAAPVQNIGAYGVEVASAIEEVRAYDTKENIWKTFSKDECLFTYRDSIFKKNSGRCIITSVVFLLKKNAELQLNYKDLQEYFSASVSSTANQPNLADVRAAILSIRSKKLPEVRVIGTAGSFFKNPIISADYYVALKKKYPDMPSYPAGESRIKIPLAWILDHICGYKGITKGNVGTYKNQALVIVNGGDATAKAIKNFADEITLTVKEKTDIDIEPEVQYVG